MQIRIESEINRLKLSELQCVVILFYDIKVALTILESRIKCVFLYETLGVMQMAQCSQNKCFSIRFFRYEIFSRRKC